MKIGWIERVTAMIQRGVDGQAAMDEVLRTVVQDMKNNPQTAHEIKAAWLDLISEMKNTLKVMKTEPSLVDLGGAS